MLLFSKIAHINIFLKLFDLAFQGLHICYEIDSVRGARCVHGVLLQLLTGLLKR